MLLVFLNGEEASFMPDMNSDGERAGFGTRFPTRETGSGRERGRSEGKGQHAPDFEQTGNVAIFARKRDLDVKTDREGGAGKDEKRGGQAIPAQGGLLRRVDAARFPVSGREGWRRRRKERASRDRRREPLQRRRTGRSVLSADQEKDRGEPPEDSAERMYPADGIHSAPLLFFNSQ
ncbi:MAG: hypothetical protein DBX67_04695 [Desulfovibrionaceae bacterium]|nr:MAG: hypothetical protein DBX67_04695 [Desulfovibrionaceae bacterium]